MKSQIAPFVDRETWDREYASIKAIPSSTRQEPAKALVMFADILGFSNHTHILDAGCGNGRNSLFLAQRGSIVTAVDFSPEAINETRRRSRTAGLQDMIKTLEFFIDDPLPLNSDSFDGAIDCYTFCHFLDDAAGRKFWHELSRVVRPQGQILSIVFSPEDEYYARFICDVEPNTRIITDPSNGVSKKLYTEQEIKNYFSGIFDRKFFAKFEFSDIVHGEPYRRVVLVSVLQVR